MAKYLRLCVVRRNLIRIEFELNLNRFKFGSNRKRVESNLFVFDSIFYEMIRFDSIRIRLEILRNDSIRFEFFLIRLNTTGRFTIRNVVNEVEHLSELP